MIAIDIRRKTFDNKTVLENIRFSIDKGELICLLGPSGCGKTTLLNILAGLDSRFEGQVDQTQCAYMFQEPRLLPWRTLRQNLELIKNAPERIDELLKLSNLENDQHQFPTKVSLGMQRRAALARCLLVDPELIIMDEPMVSLDKPMADAMRDQIQQLRKKNPDLAILYVTHDLEEARKLADRTLTLGGQPTSLV